MYHLVFNVFLYLNLCFLNVWCCGIPAIFFVVVSSLILKLFISNMFPLLFYTQPLFFLSPLHATWAPIASQSFLYIWSVVTFVSFQSFLQHISLLLDDLLPGPHFYSSMSTEMHFYICSCPCFCLQSQTHRQSSAVIFSCIYLLLCLLGFSFLCNPYVSVSSLGISCYSWSSSVV